MVSDISNTNLYCNLLCIVLYCNRHTEFEKILLENIWKNLFVNFLFFLEIVLII